MFHFKHRVAVLSSVVAIHQAVLGTAASGQTFTPIEYPGVNFTQVRGIDGAQLVGNQGGMEPGAIRTGFHYDGSTYTEIYFPGSLLTEARDIDGVNVVGLYSFGGPTGGGYVYNGVDFTTVNFPDSFYTSINGIDGDRLVGEYLGGASPGFKGFLYDGASWSTLQYPGSSETRAESVDGGRVVGWYDVTGMPGGPAPMRNGFLYDGGSYTSLAFPGSFETRALGISGENIVGDYVDSFGQHGFVYDGVEWHTLDAPFSGGTQAFGVDGDNIVGAYLPGPGRTSGFQTTKPVPPEEITFRFGGEITSIEDEMGWFNNSFQVGVPVAGEWTIFADGYSTGTFAEGSPRRNYSFYNGPNPYGLPSLPAGLSLESGGHEYLSFTRIPGVTSALSIQLVDNGDGITSPLGDRYAVVTEIPFPENFRDFTFDPVFDPNGNFYPVPRLSLDFAEEGGMALHSLDLPLTLAELVKFTSVIGALRINDANGAGQHAAVYFRIDSVSAVPEPACAILLVVVITACGSSRPLRTSLLVARSPTLRHHRRSQT